MVMTPTEQAVGRLYGRAAEYKIPIGRVADLAGVTRVTLSNWRSGRSVPSLDKFLACEAVLDELVADKNRVG